jgi:hypothetical protein
LKHHLQDAGVQKHTLEPESCGNSDSLEEIDGVPKGATSSFASPPHEGNKGERERYKSGSNHIPFDFVQHDKFPHKHGKRIACSFCGLDNHNVSRCWKRMATYRKLLKEKKQEAKGPLDKANHAVKRMHMCCTYCHKQGHLAEKCWTLNPTMLPQKLEERWKEKNGRNGKEDSMNDVFQDDSHVDADVQTKEVPLKWIGKKWLEFLSN